LFGVGVFPLRVGVLGVKVVFDGWDEGAGHTLVEKLVPVVILEPFVVL
jgi:hypothetical protein